jgi:CRISPR system Cascade subunit CasC
MKSKPLYIDIHIIQTLPPSNVNRDDAGSPKSAVYGGVRRARVSSQSWKRATRLAFEQGQPFDSGAVRTRRLQEILIDRLRRTGGYADDLAGRIAASLIEGLELAASKRAGELPYPIFFGRGQVKKAVKLVRQLVPEQTAAADLPVDELKPLLKKELGSGHPIGVALFGRMIADLAALNVDASVQVAHALSTHAVESEFDYFTAVDDENPAEETGAGMIGNIEFNSAVYYRFASVGVHQLAENLAGSWKEATDALDLFVDSFVRSVPSGHENAFAHRTRPTLVAVVVREDQPVNLVSAFEAPVSGFGGLLRDSVERLATTQTEEAERWGDKPIKCLLSVADGSLSDEAKRKAEEAFGTNLTFPALRDGLRQVVDAARQGD